MKLFWKIYFAAMFVSVTSVAVSGYILIESGFRAQLDGEMCACCDYNDIVFRSLSNELRSVGGEYPDPDRDSDDRDSIRNTVADVVRSISIGDANQRISFDVIDGEHQTVFSSLDTEHYSFVSSNIMSSLPDLTPDADGDPKTEKVYSEIRDDGERSFIRTVRPASYRGAVFYIRTYRDCTHVFEMQRSQLRMLALVMTCMLLLSGALTLVISKLLSRRVAELTEITKTVACGDLSVRAEVTGDDEIALLSRNFNSMADRLEEKICELRAEVEKRELFVGAFAHEIKTPLTSVIGYADLLRRPSLPADARRLCADYIFQEGKRLETLSMRLLELIVMKKRELTLAPVDIRSLLADVYLTFTPMLADTDIKIEFDAERAYIMMEAELIKTVFYNLIDNARKSFDGEGVIRVRGYVAGGGYTVTVSDTGRGMERAELSKITDAFYMIDKSRSRSQGGAGLGLSICREIIARHGFDISFESEPGAGTTVTVRMNAVCGEASS